VKDPLMACLLQVTEDFRRRYAKTETVDSRPLSDLDFARELKKRDGVDDGLFMVESLRQSFLSLALKYEAAFDFFGIPLLQARAHMLRMLTNSFGDAQTVIRTLAQIEQERTQKATSERKRAAAPGIEARRKTIADICEEKGWNRSTRGLLKKVLQKLDEKGQLISKNTVDADLKAIFPSNDAAG
jgi:hypothetical protein